MQTATRRGDDATTVRTRPRRRPSRAVLLCLGIAVGFNLLVLRNETTVVQNLNDMTVHSSMVRFAEHRIAHGLSPFDNWYPYLSLGFPLFHHYQSTSHVITGLLGTVIGPEHAIRWCLY